MGWTYLECMSQPEWFIVAVIKQLQEQDEQERKELKKIR